MWTVLFSLRHHRLYSMCVKVGNDNGVARVAHWSMGDLCCLMPYLGHNKLNDVYL